MRIALDGHTLGTGAGGNETYVRGLLEGLAALGAGSEVLVYVSPGASPGNGTAAGGAGFGKSIAARPVALRSSGSVRRLVWELPRRLSRDRVDVAHFQYAAPLVAPCPVMVAIHDPSFWLAPELLGRSLAARLRASTWHAVRSAAAILVPSRWTETVLTSRYPGAADRIHVVPLGCSDRFRHQASPDDPHVRRGLGLPERYVLYVGRRQRRKNVTGLLESYREAVGRDPRLPPLVLVGPPGPEDERIRRRLARWGLDEGVLLLSDVDVEALPAVYRGADLFCYPARYEGFGLPVLEAMSCGTAVLVAQEGALPELVGEAGVLLAPEEERPWAAAMVELCRDPGRLRTLGRRGRRRARGYSWRRAAELTHRHYVAAVAS